MKLYLSKSRENTHNVIFRKEANINSADDLKAAVVVDHMASKMDHAYRNISNFRETDCMMVDFDNNHSDDPNEWLTLDDISDALPDVHLYFVRSRNYMKPKRKARKDGSTEYLEPREKYHLYCPLSTTISSADDYYTTMANISALFPYFDDNAKDIARMFFGVADPHVIEVKGSKNIDDYLNEASTQKLIKAAKNQKQDAAKTAEQTVSDDVLEKVKTALSDILVSKCSYTDWIHIGIALRNIGAPFEWFDEWSKNDKRYDGAEETLKKWQSFDKSESQWNAGTIFNLRKRFANKPQQTAPEKNTSTAPSVISLAAELQSADAVEELTAEWLIPNFMPRYQITTLAGDGGTGKTTIECAIAAAITTGCNSFMTADCIPENFASDPENVLFLSAEDDFSRVLKRKLRKAGADMKRVYTLPISSPLFSKVKFASDELRQLIEGCHPALVIFDPIQAFVPPDIQMGWRNAMRQCLNPLIGYGEKYGTSFLIVCHTNKQSGSSGRRRIAESSDIWDISRSVLMVGDTGEDGIKYLSHEKSNYGELQRTILYKLDGEEVIYQGRSDLRDADYVRKDRALKPAPARDEAKQIIVNVLTEHNGQMKSADLDSILIGQGITRATRNRAKSELKQAKVIRYVKDDFSGEWITSLVQSERE